MSLNLDEIQETREIDEFVHDSINENFSLFDYE